MYSLWAYRIRAFGLFALSNLETRLLRLHEQNHLDNLHVDYILLKLFNDALRTELVQRRMIGLYVNDDEFERIWKEAILL